MHPPIVLSIAGFDPSSGAGITADIKTAAAHKCYATTCITALTVQSTIGVFSLEMVREEVVRDTLFELVRDLPPAAVRIGMLGQAAVAEVVADFLDTVKPKNVVLDPVLRSTSGAPLLDAKGLQIVRDRLIRQVDLVTPNLEEALILAQQNAPETDKNEQKMASCARTLHDLGARGVCITGGDSKDTADFLSTDEGQEWLRAPRIETRSTHGTGCAFAMAIACNLAQGLVMSEAVRRAKEYVRRAIESAPGLGQGHGPMEHMIDL